MKKKLSEQKVRTIKQLRKQGWTCTRLAERYGVSFSVIAKAARGETWKYVE